MIDNSIILTNPIVPEGYYFSKVISVESEASDYLFPKLLITVVLHPMYDISEDIKLSAILHPTEKSHYHYKNFFNAFLLGEDSSKLDKAVGRWGSIHIANSCFNGIKHSTVRFPYQPLKTRMISWRMGQDEKGASAPYCILALA